MMPFKLSIFLFRTRNGALSPIFYNIVYANKIPMNLNASTNNLKSRCRFSKT